MDRKFSEKSVIERKVNRFKNGQILRVLDLFSGCGGVSLGFLKEGFEILAGLELDHHAAQTHAANFHIDSYESHSKDRDIEKTSPRQLFKELGITGEIDSNVDVIVGGPPCQAFTRVGRAKLRDLQDDELAFLNDSRSQLYKVYLNYVRQLKPMAILMENVPDILNYGGVNVAELIAEDLDEMGYHANYTLLNSANYGVPQTRERMFLMAFHKDLDIPPSFPSPTHYIQLPKGYEGSRSVALKNIDLDNLHNYRYLIPPQAYPSLPAAISAREAIQDLPKITKHLKGGLKRGRKDLSEKEKYHSPPANQYQFLMRNWPSFISEKTVTSNVIRYLPRDYPIFKNMNEGDQYPEAIKVAKQLLKKAIQEHEKETGKPLSFKSKKYKKLVSNIIPPYDDTKFPNKWRKMEASKPARTLMAHLGKDSYSHIHFDSGQARTISVREAARLQSFPDGFQFKGAMNAAFKQIGNAVPPLLAAFLAKQIRESFEQIALCPPNQQKILKNTEQKQLSLTQAP